MAIAFDSATNPVLANSTSVTYSHTCTGSDLVLYVSVFMRNVTVSSVTYNSVAMTEIGSRVYLAASDYFAHYYLAGPATGANNVVVTISSSNIVISGATSYTGVDQTSPLDANNNRAVTTSANLTTSVTTVADNCWVVASARAQGDGNTSAGTGTTQRAGTAGYHQMYDKNAATTPAGSASINTTQTVQLVVHLLASFAPSVASSTSIKSFNGLAQASVKSVNGLAIASVKSRNGLSNVS